jgi:hypothetical protein
MMVMPARIDRVAADLSEMLESLCFPVGCE